MTDDLIALVEDIIGGAMLLALAIVPVIETITRLLFGSGLIWSVGFLRHVVVWVAWIGGITASREGGHLSLTAGNVPKTLFGKISGTVRDVWASAINFSFAVASISFIILGITPEETIGVVPLRLILIIALGTELPA